MKYITCQTYGCASIRALIVKALMKDSLSSYLFYAVMILHSFSCAAKVMSAPAAEWESEPEETEAIWSMFLKHTAQFFISPSTFTS